MDASVSKRQGSTTVRTFLAVELPDALKQRLGALSQRFGPAGGAVRWTDPRLLHSTLRFLGEVNADLLPVVVEAACDAASECQPFRLTVRGIGGFPTPRAPRVVWVGLDAGPGLDALMALHAAVECELGSRGFPMDDRPFSPHITIGRTRQHASVADRSSVGQALRELESAWTASMDIDVRQVTVMESILGSGGPTYIPRARADLGSA
jgi:2'-5' RNA ligase